MDLVSASEGKISVNRETMYHSWYLFRMQLATVEFSRNVLGLEGAHSAELDPATPYPIIDLLPEQKILKI